VTSLARIADSFFKPPVRDLVPYEPGKPVEEVQRELGLDRVVKLASNEGPFGPFPEAIDALAALAPQLNRYPDGGGYRLRTALAERHGVRFEEIALGAGADGIVDALSQLSLEPRDEIVCGWPSFPSYVIGAVKLGAAARTIRSPTAATTSMRCSQRSPAAPSSSTSATRTTRLGR
jgi:histidinol-phosphate aminotransferase